MKAIRFTFKAVLAFFCGYIIAGVYLGYLLGRELRRITHFGF
jgi:hypothetical protein